MSRPDQDVWGDFVARHDVGDVLDGRVVKVVPFGAFVEVSQGVHGLLVSRPQPEAEASVSVRIAEIDNDGQRLRLTRP
ncbi:S1 RNA-binding domain-containing protein [Solihabitans fulvus]|uniref:S1 RNA-binding domain-containing protein n=1 Tax=Solihabitans fulvus TaxID=1892852 RepID=A0A5B2XTZ1_9PSEU|nr:S1 RNA-binding domain-containing protein [Solihabitans fulvus]KAA2266966.1 S1 RNA-binding domain-containing protein [Solihabitans fulvus]